MADDIYFKYFFWETENILVVPQWLFLHSFITRSYKKEARNR